MRMLLFLAFLLGMAGGAWAQGPSLPPGTRFILSHFAEFPITGQDERLYISTSADGLSWQSLNNGAPVWQPAGWKAFENVVRDPAIIYEGGWFWVAYTSGTNGRHQSFGLVKSTDLVNWLFVGEISSPRPGATSQLTWNPVWFRDGDGSVHLFISLSLTGAANSYPVPDMQVYEMHPLNAAFTQWSAPVLLDLQPPNTNELWVWKEGATYHALYVNLQGGQQLHAASKNLLTGWSAPQGLGHDGEEGGMMLPKPEGGYRLYVESGYTGKPVGYRTYEYDAAMAPVSAGTLVTSSVPMKNGKMTAAPRTTTFADWQAQYLSDLSTAEQSATADPDHDGRNNLLECAAALSPRFSADLLPPGGYLSQTAAGAPCLAFRYRRLPSLSDVSCVVQSAGADLVFGILGANFATRGLTLLSDGSEQVDLADTADVLSSSTRFLRLQATGPAGAAVAPLSRQPVTTRSASDRRRR